MSSDHFDRVAADYDASIPTAVMEHYLGKRQAFIERWCPRGRALDVGCGTGVLAGRLAAGGWSMVGIDASPGMLERLRARASDVEAVRGEATALPFADGEFDLVYCVAVLHHVAKPGAVRLALSEMVRVARIGGRVLVWDHNPRNPYWPIIMRRVPQDQGTERLVPLDEVADGLAAAGSEIVVSTQLGLVPDFVPTSLLGFFTAIERAAEATPGLRRLCAHNVVLATKR